MLQGDKDDNHEFSILLLLTFILWYSAIAELTFGNLTAMHFNIYNNDNSNSNNNYNWGRGTICVEDLSHIM